MVLRIGIKIEIGRGRRFAPLPRPAVLAIAMLSMLPPVAVCAAVPDSLTLARLNTAATEHNRFRIVTHHGQFLVTTLRMDVNGVVVRAPQAHPAVFATSEIRPDETKCASWSEIDHIEGARSHGLRGAMIGGLIGGIAGLGAKQMFQNSLHDASDVAILAIPIGAALGGLVGAVTGGSTGWRPLYP